MQFKDSYYAARQLDGELIPNIGEVANPKSIPVMVMRFIDDEDYDQTAIYHGDLDKIEIGGTLYDLDSIIAMPVLELLQKHLPGDEPDPNILTQDLMTREILQEMDIDIINNLRSIRGDPPIPLPKEPVKLRSIVKNNCVPVV